MILQVTGSGPLVSPLPFRVPHAARAKSPITGTAALSMCLQGAVPGESQGQGVLGSPSCTGTAHDSTTYRRVCRQHRFISPTLIGGARLAFSFTESQSCPQVFWCHTTWRGWGRGQSGNREGW